MELVSSFCKSFCFSFWRGFLFWQ